MDKGRGTVPWLNLLSDDRLHLSVVFAPVLDKWLDGSIEVVGQFTAGLGTVSAFRASWYVMDRGRCYLKGQT